MFVIGNIGDFFIIEIGDCFNFMLVFVIIVNLKYYEIIILGFFVEFVVGLIWFFLIFVKNWFFFSVIGVFYLLFIVLNIIVLIFGFIN